MDSRLHGNDGLYFIRTISFFGRADSSTLTAIPEQLNQEAMQQTWEFES